MAEHCRTSWLQHWILSQCFGDLQLSGVCVGEVVRLTRPVILVLQHEPGVNPFQNPLGTLCALLPVDFGDLWSVFMWLELELDVDRK